MGTSEGTEVVDVRGELVEESLAIEEQLAVEDRILNNALECSRRVVSIPNQTSSLGLQLDDWRGRVRWMAALHIETLNV